MYLQLLKRWSRSSLSVPCSPPATVLPYYLAQYLQWEGIWWVFAERMEEKDGQEDGRKEEKEGGIKER